jgi:hypothetical protein
MVVTKVPEHVGVPDDPYARVLDEVPQAAGGDVPGPSGRRGS